MAKVTSKKNIKYVISGEDKSKEDIRILKLVKCANGVTLHDFTSGLNIATLNANGTLTLHGYVHPEYVTEGPQQYIKVVKG